VDERSSKVDERDFNSSLLPPPPLPQKLRGWLFQLGFAKLTHIKFAIKYFQLATARRLGYRCGKQNTIHR
jgi:hypothetical protein